MRRPPQFAPYHLRLDWLMWFLPLGGGNDLWFVRLVEKATRGRPADPAFVPRESFSRGTAALAPRSRCISTSSPARKSVLLQAPGGSASWRATTWPRWRFPSVSEHARVCANAGGLNRSRGCARPPRDSSCARLGSARYEASLVRCGGAPRGWLARDRRRRRRRMRAYPNKCRRDFL